MRYFAYGSNMLTTRLVRRVGEVELLGRGEIPGRRLAFHKRSGDGSGKCDIPEAGPADRVHGAVYEISDDAVGALDRFESGYERRVLEVKLEGVSAGVQVYLADPEHVDENARPFDWYLRLVEAGFRQHGLFGQYRSVLENVVDQPDPVLDRSDRLEALSILREFYSAGAGFLSRK